MSLFKTHVHYTTSLIKLINKCKCTIMKLSDIYFNDLVNMCTYNV